MRRGRGAGAVFIAVVRSMGSDGGLRWRGGLGGVEGCVVGWDGCGAAGWRVWTVFRVSVGEISGL